MRWRSNAPIRAERFSAQPLRLLTGGHWQHFRLNVFSAVERIAAGSAYRMKSRLTMSCRSEFSLSSLHRDVTATEFLIQPVNVALHFENTLRWVSHQGSRE
jgi:hypothetical protein